MAVALPQLPVAVITAQRLRQQAKELVLMAEELEASVPKQAPQAGSGVFLFGQVTPRKLGKSKKDAPQ